MLNQKYTCAHAATATNSVVIGSAVLTPQAILWILVVIMWCNSTTNIGSTYTQRCEGVLVTIWIDDGHDVPFILEFKLKYFFFL